MRLVGSRTFCGEACAIIWLSEEASRTAWQRTVLEMDRRHPAPLRRVKLAVARQAATRTQRRLDRRLASGPKAQALPWVWVPPRGSAIILVLMLLACGVVGAYPPDAAFTSTTAPPVAGSPAIDMAARLARPASPPSQSLLPPPEPPPVPAPAPKPAALPAPPAPPPVRTVRPAPTPARPASRLVAEDVTRGNTAIREVAFTFDGGDDANVANEILDALWARRVQTTLFLTGQFIRMHPDLVRRIVAEGHEVGNHTDTHPHLTTYAETRRQQTRSGVSRESLTAQLRRTEEAFQSLTGQPMAPYWRAPYGEHNAEIRAWAAEAGYRHISWTRGAGTAEDLDTRDWVADRSSRIYRSRDEIATRILEFGKNRPEGLNGGIVLMHLATHRKTDRPHEGLPQVLRTLQGQGYRIVTISELLESAPSASTGDSSPKR